MKERINQYLQAAKEADIKAIDELFSEDAIYGESNGAVHRGRDQIKEWFRQVTSYGQVVEWTLKRVIGTDALAAAEWYFEYCMDGTTISFDGVSIVEVDCGRIKSWQEYAINTEMSY